MRTQTLHGSLDAQVGPCARAVPGAGGCPGGWQQLSCGARAAVGQQRRGDGSEAVLGRLEALEADVRFLCTELGAEKLLWSSRFLELLREQQSLRQRVSAPGGASPLPPPTAQNLTACCSCRSCRGSGTALTAPSCSGKQRTKVPVGVRERVQKVRAGSCGGHMDSVTGEGVMMCWTCHQSWGWGNVLTSVNGQCTCSHLGTGEAGAGKGSQFSVSVPIRSVAGCSHWCPPLSVLCSFPGRQWLEAPRQPRASIQPDRQQM